jgi:hypothetical protein
MAFKRILPITTIGFLSFVIISISCNKLDTTDIGGDLLPAIDNINTFETTLPVITTQGIFNDTTLLSKTQDHIVGSISNDAVFGKSNANIYLELKPGFFKYYWGNAKDTIVGFDSVILCLNYKGFFGDTTAPQVLKAYQVSNAVTDFKDSGYRLNYAPALGNQIGSANIVPQNLKNWVVFKNKKDSVQNQIRIKITNPAFLSALYAQDSTGNNAFVSDSLFRSFYKGFAIVADSTTGNGLFYSSIIDAKTRLEVHFRRKNGGAVDTTFSTFNFNNFGTSINSFSASANYLSRKRSGAEINTPSPDAVYVQATPGTYVNLNIPALDTLSNRIIHRAELIMEQIPDPQFKTFSTPNFLYIDCIDTPNVRWKPIPYDLSPNTFYSFYPTNGVIDFATFGGYIRSKTDALTGNAIGYYNFNISRYVQHIVTNHERNYNLRLYAPYQLIYPEFFFGGISFSNSLAFGRVKLGNGTNPNYRLRLHIVYSKI